MTGVQLASTQDDLAKALPTNSAALMCARLRHFFAPS